MKPDLLITTNGFQGTWPSIEYGAWLARVLETRIALLGINENLNPAAIDDHHPLEDVFARAVALFQQDELEYSLEVQNGNAEDIIPRKARQGAFITVLGPLGRPPIRRLIAGRSIRHLMEEIEQPILYVPESKLPLKKLLICIGGLGYEVTAEHLAMQIAMKSRAHGEQELAAPRRNGHADRAEFTTGARHRQGRRLDRQRESAARQRGRGNIERDQGGRVRSAVYGLALQRQLIATAVCAKCYS